MRTSGPEEADSGSRWRVGSGKPIHSRNELKIYKKGKRIRREDGLEPLPDLRSNRNALVDDSRKVIFVIGVYGRGSLFFHSFRREEWLLFSSGKTKALIPARFS